MSQLNNLTDDKKENDLNLPNRKYRDIDYFRKLTKDNLSFTFLILTSALHNSHWFFTHFLNHVTKQLACTYCEDPEHLQGAISGSSP